MNGPGTATFFTDRIFWQDVMNRAVFILTPGYAASVEMERAFWEGRYIHAVEWLVVGLSEMFLAALSAGSSQSVNALVRQSLFGNTTIRSASAVYQRGTTVLGHFPEYLTRAAQLGANHFNIPGTVWARMAPADRWAANERFLADVVERGDEVVLTTAVGRVTVGSTLEREIQYLLGRGYQIVEGGWRLIPGR